MKLLVLYYSAFGYVTVMANAVAEGARSVGADVDIKRVPEIARAAASEGSNFKREQSVPVAKIDDLADYDAIIVGCPTRFGRLASQMAAFLDQASPLAKQGVLAGKVGGAFTSPSGHHGGHESATLSILTNLLHFGMVIVGPPYSATTTEDDAGQRHPSEHDLAGAREQGIVIAQTAQKLFG
jgi:NAD(P)H dehydrogenase (quinone)